jgi:hypothetical protein
MAQPIRAVLLHPRTATCCDVVFASIDELVVRIVTFVKDYNSRAAPFSWTYDGNF